MVLTDREIETALKAGHILNDPAPSAEAFSSSALDLTLAPTLYTWKTPASKGVDQIISPAREGYSYTELARELRKRMDVGPEGHVLEPRDFVLALTAETVTLPAESRIAARVEGKSSLARLGIAVHVTAPTVHIGFQGQIQLEISNQGPLSVRLTPGMHICQLIFEQTLGTPNKGYRGQFFGQDESA